MSVWYFDILTPVKHWQTFEAAASFTVVPREIIGSTAVRKAQLMATDLSERNAGIPAVWLLYRSAWKLYCPKADLWSLVEQLSSFVPDSRTTAAATIHPDSSRLRDINKNAIFRVNKSELSWCKRVFFHILLFLSRPLQYCICSTFSLININTLQQQCQNAVLVSRMKEGWICWKGQSVFA